MQNWQTELPEAQGSVTVKHQTKELWRSEPFGVRANHEGYQLVVEARWDDRCGNGSNSFHLYEKLVTVTYGNESEMYNWGDAPARIRNAAPRCYLELAKWNGCHPFGPWYYIENTIYLAGDRDHNKLRKGERRQLRNGKTGQPCWRLKAVDAAGQETDLYRLTDIVDSNEKPEHQLRLEYVPVWIEGEGKDRQLDSARSVAIWPDATDEELMADDLEERLRARLPGLLVEFREAIEWAGFVW